MLQRRIDDLHQALRAAAERGDRETADALLMQLIELEQERDARPGDFADDCCGDPSMALVPGLACS